MSWSDTSLETDWTLKRQHQVESRELLELLRPDRTRPISLDRTYPASDHPKPRALPPLTRRDAQRQVTQSIEHPITMKNYTERSRAWPYTSDHYWSDEHQISVTSALVAHIGSKYQTRSVTSTAQAWARVTHRTRLVSMSDASGHLVTSANNSFLNTDFFSFANVPTPRSVHHHMYVC
jgi:hypothetical protein